MNAVDLIVNLLHEQTCKGSSEMLHAFIWYCTGTSYGMVAHVI